MPGHFVDDGRAFIEGLKGGNIAHFRQGDEQPDGDPLESDDYEIAWKSFSPALSTIKTGEEYSEWARDLANTLVNSEALPREERRAWLGRALYQPLTVTPDFHGTEQTTGVLPSPPELPASSEPLEDQGNSTARGKGMLFAVESPEGQDAPPGRQFKHTAQGSHGLSSPHQQSTMSIQDTRGSTADSHRRSSPLGQEIVSGRAPTSGGSRRVGPRAVLTSRHCHSGLSSEAMGRGVSNRGHGCQVSSRGTMQHGRVIGKDKGQRAGCGAPHSNRHAAGSRPHPIRADAKRPAGGPLLPMASKKKHTIPTFSGERCQLPQTAAVLRTNQVARRNEGPATGGCKTGNRGHVEPQRFTHARNVQVKRERQGVQPSRPKAHVETTRIVESSSSRPSQQRGAHGRPTADMADLKQQRIAALPVVRRHPDSHELIRTISLTGKRFDVHQIKFAGGSLSMQIQNLFMGAPTRRRTSVWKCTVCGDVFIDQRSAWNHSCSGRRAGQGKSPSRRRTRW